MDLEIFDKDGKPLRIADVIYSYIKSKAKESNKDFEDVYVGVTGFKGTWIGTYEAVDNSYDAIDLNEFGEAEEVIQK